MEAAATQEQFKFPWNEDKPLFQTYNELANRGREMVNVFIGKHRSMFETDKSFRPFEDLYDFLGDMHSRLSSINRLSLLAYSLLNPDVLRDHDGVRVEDNRNIEYKDDKSICASIGGDLNQCQKTNPDFSLYINEEQFFVDDVEGEEGEERKVKVCIKFFEILKSKRQDLTSTQFLYLLLGIQQKNMNELIPAFNNGACKGAIEKNIHEYDSYIQSLRRKFIQTTNQYWLKEFSDALHHSICSTLTMNPMNTKISIFLPPSDSDKRIIVGFNLIIPIKSIHALENPLFVLKNFNFISNVAGGEKESYYEMTDAYIEFIIGILNFFYTFFITYPIKKPNRIQESNRKIIINVDWNEWNLLVKSIPQEIETMKAQEASAAARRVEADVFSKLGRQGGGKRQPNRPNRKKASSVLSSKQYFSRKNKSRRRKNKSRRKN